MPAAQPPAADLIGEFGALSAGAAAKGGDEVLKDVVANGRRWWVLPEDTPK